MHKDNTARVMESHPCGNDSAGTAHPCSVLPFLSFDVRVIRSAALDVAMRATSTTNGQLARALGVSDTLARDLRSARRPLTDARVALFGARLRTAYESAILGPLQLRLF